MLTSVQNLFLEEDIPSYKRYFLKGANGWNIRQTRLSIYNVENFSSEEIEDWCHRYYDIFNRDLVEKYRLSNFNTENFSKEDLFKIGITIAAFAPSKNIEHFDMEIHQYGHNLICPKLRVSNRWVANNVHAANLPKGNMFSILGVKSKWITTNITSNHVKQQCSFFIRSREEIKEVKNIEILLDENLVEIVFLNDLYFSAETEKSNVDVNSWDNHNFGRFIPTPHQIRCYLSWAAEVGIYDPAPDLPDEAYVKVKEKHWTKPAEADLFIEAEDESKGVENSLSYLDNLYYVRNEITTTLKMLNIASKLKETRFEKIDIDPIKYDFESLLFNLDLLIAGAKQETPSFLSEILNFLEKQEE